MTRSGSSSLHGRDDVDAGMDPVDGVAVAAERGLDLVEETIGIGGEQHDGHGRGATARAAAR